MGLNLKKAFEGNWSNIICLMQNIIRSFPQYNNIEGLEKAANFIKSYLKNEKIDYIKLKYKNTSFQSHNLYVQVESFGPAFVDDRKRIKENILAIIDSGQPGKTLILNGHYDVDTVSTPEQWSEKNGWKTGEIKNNILYGRGSTDMVGGLCSFLFLIKILNENKKKWKGKVIFTAVCDEEIGGNSTLKTLLWLKEKKYINNTVSAFISEPSDNLICQESLGFFHMKMTATRKSVHMGVAKKSNNALYDIMDLISLFPEILNNICKKLRQKEYRAKIINNWGILSGGNDAAIPLGKVDIEGVIFLPEQINNKDFQKFLSREIKKITKGIIELQFSSFHFEGAISNKNPLDKYLLNEKYFPSKYTASRGLFPSPCDARLFKAFSIPVTIYGPGSLAQAHTIDEHIDLEEVLKYTKHITKSVFKYMYD